MSWCDITIGDLGRVVTGKTPETKNRGFYDGAYPFVTPSDIGFNHYICEKTEASVTDLARDRLSNQFIPAGSVIVTCIGNTIGKTAIAATECLTNQQMNSIVVSDSYDEKFVYYLMLHNVERIRGVGLGGGAAQPIINKSTFSALKVRVPDKQTQTAIAKLLSAYDDLIANNTHRIALLEKSARLLFEEWFVRLRYPRHEHDKIVDGMTQGWQRVGLAEITTKIGSGATPRGGETAYLSEGITLIRSQNVYDFNFTDVGLAYINEHQAQRLANVEVERFDILLNITGASVARCCMVPARLLPARVNQHVMIIRADPLRVNPYFLLCAMNSDERKRQLLSYAHVGATREALTKELISRFEILLPDARTLHAFGEVARDLFAQGELLQEQNAKLLTARELLLPRLMDGRIEV
jgi:type I restriction enzyme, S subunit